MSASEFQGMAGLIPPYIAIKLLDHYRDQVEGLDEHSALVEPPRERVMLDDQVASMTAAVEASRNRGLSTIDRQTRALAKSALNMGVPARGTAARSAPGGILRSPVEIWSCRSHPPRQLLSSSAPEMRTDEVDALAAFKALQLADRYYKSSFNIWPVPRAHVHNRAAYNNAFCDDSSINFGEFDPRVFTSFVRDDVTVREFGHAAVRYTSDFTYMGQSGALGESIADVFATIYLHLRDNKRAADPDAQWLIAPGLIVNPDDQGTALRSMKEPGTAFKNQVVIGDDRQIGHMRHFVRTRDDNGGVHLNSGIPNRAFYLAAHGDQGRSWERMGPIWARALADADADDNFTTFAGRTITAARACPEGVQQIVHKAWTDVGVDLTLLSALSVQDEGPVRRRRT